MHISDGQYFDAVVVGAGPAGSSFAIRLAAKGRTVLLIDKSSFPRHKLCGEFISPECLTHFAELGIEHQITGLGAPELHETHFFTRAGRALRIPNKWLSRSTDNAIGVSRYALDNVLVKSAQSSGVLMLEETAAARPVTDGSGLSGLVIRTVDGSEITIRTQLAVDATGRARSLSRLFKTKEPHTTGLVAFKAHFENVMVQSSVCEMYNFPGGYGGCSEIENHIFDHCFIVDSAAVRRIGNDQDSIFRQLVLQNSRAKFAFSMSRRTTDWITVSIPKFGREELSVFRGVIAIGDAAGFIDPFTGSGISIALHTAKICAEAVGRNQRFEDILREYTKLYNASVAKRMRICSAFRHLTSFPKLADRMIEVVGYTPFLRAIAAKATRYGSID